MSTSDISRDITRDLDALLSDMSQKECARAWKGALRSAAASVRKAAVAGARKAFKTTPTGHMPKPDKWTGRKVKDIVNTIKAEVRRDGSGFTVRATPSRKHPSAGVHVNRWGKAKPVVMWADVGVRKAGHKGWKRDLPAARFMEAAAKAELPAALAGVRAKVEERAAKIVDKRIRKDYGK